MALVLDKEPVFQPGRKTAYKQNTRATNVKIAKMIVLKRGDGSDCTEGCVRDEIKDWLKQKESKKGSVMYDLIVIQTPMRHIGAKAAENLKSLIQKRALSFLSRFSCF